VTLNRPVVDGGASFTVAVRVKLGDPDKPMVIARQGTGGKDSWRLEYKPINTYQSQWIFARGDAGSSTETLAISTVDREFVGGWHLLAASYVGLTGQIAGPASELVLSVDGRGSNGSSPSYPGSPLRTGSTVVGAAATSGKTFTGNLDDLRLYAGVAQGSRLCQDYAGLEWCGS
jgi:hypothetical protein